MFEKLLLDGKTVLVSGATQGLGAEIARTAVREGARAVAITGRNEEAGTRVRDELRAAGALAEFLPTDLADSERARASVVDTIKAFGGLDCVVNAAGITTRGSFLDTTPELFDQHMAINVRAPFFIMSEAIRHMKETGTAGTIVNIISISQHAGPPFLAPYVTSKAALAGATRNAAHAHRWDRIRVNGVNIGWSETDGEAVTQRTFHGATDDWVAEAGARMPMGKLGQVDEIAEFVVFLLSERSGVVTGSVIDWDQNVPGGED